VVDWYLMAMLNLMMLERKAGIGRVDGGVFDVSADSSKSSVGTEAKLMTYYKDITD
jgi:hypothetical protein